MIEITVNERSRSVEQGTTLAQLLVQLEILSPAIAVEVNQQLRPRDEFDTALEAGDVLEIVTLVGGG